MTYLDMNPCTKGINLTIESWRPPRYGEGWKVLVEALKIAYLKGKWDKVEEIYNPILVKGVT